MAISSPLGRRQTVAALLTLTFVTGLVDAVSYLRLGHVFVANMTGNVVFLGFSADPRSGLSAAASVIAIAGFVLGALAGGRAAHHLAARHLRGWLAGAFAAEALIIGAVAALAGAGLLPYAGDGRFATIAILAAALGVQNSHRPPPRRARPDHHRADADPHRGGRGQHPGRRPGAKPHRRLGSAAAMLAGAARGRRDPRTCPPPRSSRSRPSSSPWWRAHSRPRPRAWPPRSAAGRTQGSPRQGAGHPPLE